MTTLKTNLTAAQLIEEATSAVNAMFHNLHKDEVSFLNKLITAYGKTGKLTVSQMNYIAETIDV
jgi:hypothetical protein